MAVLKWNVDTNRDDYLEHYLNTKTGRNLFSRYCEAGAAEPHQGQPEQLCVFPYESII